jgi:CBS domain-containing protein
MIASTAKLAGLTVAQAMRINIRALAPYEWLSHAVDHMTATGQQDFPIVQNGRVVGMLTRDALLRGLRQFGAYSPVSTVMQPNIAAIEAEQSLVTASETMQANQVLALPVTQNGVLVGLLTLEGISEFLRVQAALRAARTEGTPRVV